MSIRELPKIDFDGTLFYIDLRLNEFRQVDNFMNRIDIDALYETESGYKVWYDPKAKNVFEGSEGEFIHRQKDLKLLEFPTLEQMDPVGFENLVNAWKQDNPMLSAMIQSLPVVLNDGKTTTIGDVLKGNHQPTGLLEKNRTTQSKGQKL